MNQRHEPGGRLEREASFHDGVFDKGGRRPASRFYSILEPLKQDKALMVAERAAGSRILEYGCGPEGMTSLFWPAAKSVDLIDISPVAIEQVKRSAAEHGNVRATVMNAEALEFEDNSFDLIVGDGILHHLVLSSALGELDRVLSDEGSALFVEPLAANPVVAAYRRVTPNQRTADEHPLTARDFATIEGFFPATTMTPCGLLSVAAAVVPVGRRQQRMIEVLTSFDRRLFVSHRLRSLAWACLLDLRR